MKLETAFGVFGCFVLAYLVQTVGLSAGFSWLVSTGIGIFVGGFMLLQLWRTRGTS